MRDSPVGREDHFLQAPKKQSTDQQRAKPLHEISFLVLLEHRPRKHDREDDRDGNRADINNNLDHRQQLAIPENKNMPVKGAILVTVSQIIQSA